MRFNHSILGGTFDHFHAGHAHFTRAAFDKSENVTIGLTSNKFAQSKPFPHTIEDYKTRRKNLESFLEKNKFLNRTNIVTINNIYGTTLDEKKIDAIFVTAHGVPAARIINQKRIGSNFPKLTVVKVTYLRGEDGKIISSTRIRSGEIDRLGHVYEKIFQNSELVLPDDLREQTKNTPQGKLIKSNSELAMCVRDANFIIAIGDVISSNLIDLGRQADVSVIDYKIKRKSVRNKIFKPTLEAENEPGTIHSDAVRILKKAIDQALEENKQIIRATGEEDLLALPATLLAPLGSLIIYGMPGVGAIAAEVTEEQKERVRKLLEKFARI